MNDRRRLRSGLQRLRLVAFVRSGVGGQENVSIFELGNSCPCGVWSPPGMWDKTNLSELGAPLLHCESNERIGRWHDRDSFQFVGINFRQMLQ